LSASPPEAERAAALGQADGPEDLLNGYVDLAGDLPLLQATLQATDSGSWRIEALRLAREHRRTGCERHLRALALHCKGIGVRIAIASAGGKDEEVIEATSARDPRHCCVCGAAISNGNLGGYSGRSALSGVVWCVRCLDVPTAGGNR
jgi:hypothetical protein